MTAVFSVLAMFAVIVILFWCLMLARISKTSDEAMHKAFKDYTDTQRDPYLDNVVPTCTRLAPHVCKVNGPCNGFPKEKP
jgi:hypothetical protein